MVMYKRHLYFISNYFYTFIMYRKVTSTSPSCLKAHAGFFRLSMKEKFEVLFTVTFWGKVDFRIIKTH